MYVPGCNCSGLAMGRGRALSVLLADETALSGVPSDFMSTAVMVGSASKSRCMSRVISLHSPSRPITITRLTCLSSVSARLTSSMGESLTITLADMRSRSFWSATVSGWQSLMDMSLRPASPRRAGSR